MKDIQQVYTEENIDFDPYLFPAFHKIATSGPITNTSLRESLHTSQPAVTQTINKLSKKNLVVLEDDEHDGRKKQIRLSPKGEVYLHRLQPIWNVMDKAVKKYTTEPAGTMLEHISVFEQALEDGDLTSSIRKSLSRQKKLEIISYDPAFRQDFYDLNVEWLETYFYVEDFDREVLSNPEKYIIGPGGYIFFAKEGDQILGTVALMVHHSGVFELTKMAVLPNQRGKKVGQQLMQHCIDHAKSLGESKLILYSNTILENAIHIYRKFGFIEIDVEPDSPYVRSNIKMELML